jgi:hypothetical protein
VGDSIRASFRERPAAVKRPRGGSTARCLLGATVLVALLAGCRAGDQGRPDGHEGRATPGGEAAADPISPTVEPAPASPAPPEDGGTPEEQQERTRFAGRISRVPAAIGAEMRGTTWKPGCPVPISGLRLLRFNYWGFDGEVKRGPMVINARVSHDVLGVFERLFEARFPMKRVGLAREFVASRLETDPNSRRSVTASFNCRVVVTPAGPGDEFSQHAYGLAVDVNPLQNPFVREDGWVRNRFARPYVDRTGDHPGMIHPGDVVVSAFAAIGWGWGGDWGGAKDYMHFSLLGR